MTQAQPAAVRAPLADGDPVPSILEADGDYEDVVIDGRSLEPAPGGDLDGLSLERVVLRNVRLAGTTMAHGRLTDVVFDTCDLAGAMWTDLSAVRVSFVDCRISGWQAAAGNMTDIRLERCRGEGASVFGTTGKRWRLAGCEFPGLDARELRLDYLHVSGCVLTGSEWARAQLGGAVFEHCDLAGFGGADGLRGTSLDTPTMLSAAVGMAKHLGVTITD